MSRLQIPLRDTQYVPDSPLHTVGGYRILRTIGVGSRAEVFIAHPVRDLSDAEPVVVKVYGPAVTDESIYLEVEALTRAAGEHVVRVIDVASAPDGAPVLILSRHAAGNLARLLADRVTLEPGEAITILAPIATALARMHAAGVAHGGLSAASLLFDAAGAPTLACFGRAILFPPHLPAAKLETEPAVLADIIAFGVLAATVLDRAGSSELAHSARTEAAPGDWLHEFGDRLFDVAQPLPIDLRPATRAEALLPSRVIAMAPHVLAERAIEVSPRGNEWQHRIAHVLRSVRRPVWVVAGVVCALLVAVAIAPHTSTDAIESSPTPTFEGSTHAPGPVEGDDPVAAASVLLETRERCIRDLDELCFLDVDQSDSSALDYDRALVRSVVAGGAALLPQLDDLELVRDSETLRSSHWAPIANRPRSF